MIAHLSIGNSDDKLAQADWARFQAQFKRIVTEAADALHGCFFSEPSSAFQNMCIIIEISPLRLEMLKSALTALRDAFGQESIALLAAPETEFI